MDDSIVELENIQRHLNTGQSRWQAIVEAAREVAMPIFASTVTTVVVFLPILFVVGIAKLLFIPLTLTIAIALFTSFFVSRTVTPALCFKFLKPEHEVQRSMPGSVSRLMDRTRLLYERMDRRYQEMLSWALAHRKILIGSILLFFVASLLLVPLIGTEFIPVTDESQFRIVVRAPVGQRIEKTEQQVAEIERVLRENISPQEIDTIVSSTGVLQQGRSSLFNPNTGPHTSLVQVYLVPPDRRRRNQVQIMNDVRPKILTLFPGVAMFFDPGRIGQTSHQFRLPKVDRRRNLRLRLEKARGASGRCRTSCTKYRAWRISKSAGKKTTRRSTSVVDREKAALLGISETNVANAVLFSLQRQRPDRPHHLHRSDKTGMSITSARGLTKNIEKT